MHKVQWGNLAIIAVLFVFATIVCAPTLRVAHMLSWLPFLPVDYTKHKLELGLDLQGGIDLTYQVSVSSSIKTSRAQEINPQDLAATAKEVLQDRLDTMGVANPILQVQGEKHDQIRIQVPTVEDKKQRQIKDIVRITNLLQFNEVLQDGETIADFDASQADTIVLEEVEQRDPKTKKMRRGRFYLLKKEPEITGEELEAADVMHGPAGAPEIHFEWTSSAAEKFGRITERLLHKRLAIVLGGRVYMAPEVQSRIEKRGQITGSFDLDEARRVVRILRAGALPADLTPLAESSIGPTLGADTVAQGMRASFWGAVLVVIFMVAFYKVSGAFANIAMFLNLLMQLACLVFLEATLTLPGIAGFALTVGMAVDSNVLIFERVKEELRAGKTVRASIDAGYEKAFWTIIDSHVTTILTGIILYHFGSGPIRGFAVTLVIGLLVNLFTAVWVTRVFQECYYAGKGITRMSI
jgi:preprotein translocase subunit SecD